MTEEPQVIELSPQPIFGIRIQVPPTRLGEELEPLFERILDLIDSRGLEPDGLPCVIFHDIKDYMLDVEAAIPIAQEAATEGEVLAGELPGGPAVRLTNRGPYRSLHEAYTFLSHWLVESGLTPRGPFWEVYSTETETPGGEDDWTTDIFWPVEEPDPET